MRLDEFLVEKNYYNSRTKAKEGISRGEVFVNGNCIQKPAFAITDGEEIKIIKKVSDFVSNGGFKLEKALFDFNYSVKHLVAADIGASTGGFTDCLLKYGAEKFFSVDLNDDLLALSLKNDERVERVIKNARYLTKEDFSCNIDVLVADLSFISATYVLPVFYDLLCENGDAIVLIKPQFENDGKIKFKNGIVSDKKIRLSACKKIYDCAIECGFFITGFTTAPIRKSKNTEYLIKLSKNAEKSISFDNFIVD